MSQSLIGVGVPRIDGVEKVTGEALYVHDLKIQGMLYAALKTSPYAHARILRIDTSRARSLPGVKAVLTGQDVPYRLGLYMIDRPLLATGKVRYYGEPVAAVAALDLDTAREAADLIEVEYEPLPVVQDVEEALREDAPLVHEDLATYSWIKGVYFPKPGTNIANHFKVRKGDIESGFARADLIVENKFFQPQVLHMPLETHVTIARWSSGDRIKIWTSAQSPFAVRDLLSMTIGVPRSHIEVIVPYVGGGFGGKAGIHLEALVACLSRAARGRPVKLTATREEEIASLPCRQGLLSKIKTGVTREGRIIAEEIAYLWDAGAYADYGVNIGRAAGYSGVGPYEIENVKIDSYTIYTNHIFGTAYRGFGHAEFFWAIERQRDIIARKLGMDALEFRMKNLLKPGSVTITGEKIHENTGRVDKCLALVAEKIGWPLVKTEEEKAREKETGRYRGLGLAVLHKAPAMPPSTASSAIVKMNEDGSVNVLVSGIDYGQGTYTTLAQIAAERLHLPLEKVHVVWETSTETSPYDWQTVASRFTVMGGNAVIRACDDLLAQMKSLAAGILRAAEEELEFGQEEIYVRHHPDQKLAYRELAIGYTYGNGNAVGGPLIGRGRYIAQGLTFLDAETGQGRPALDWTYGAHGIEIEVDTKTGNIRVLRIVSAFDVGRVLNEMLVKGQVIGGIVQGLGTAFSEVLLYDREGRLLTRNLVDYKIPTAKDLPDVIETYFVETPQLDGPYGARGVAEHPMISITSAIGNALANATGLELYEVPLSAERVYLAWQEKA
ncbi:xanthine dehydrogenase family protein molybdopterin-binding subunit [Neomoorella thermoacetica]|uniref:xanthine dehydrogenase family protein molybdopterin-binding subunit n=1 Tax=Neomoorella thermoacetica TaxID=1525 RepID=UPI0008FB14C1|nr:xanthine dehydrogenase family protein molybdopterin-binding subunit [Moorella thermoacetica]OIQ54842.1 4-hydroxybenzoyl-CoA reductase subunit alpha [Moorella thermoacetica]